MALRKRGLKVAVTTMAIISVISSGGLNNIYADGSITKNTTAIERTLEDKTYSVTNKIEYIKDDEIITSGHGYQSLRDSLSENTIIEVKNSKIYMTLEFTDSQYSLIDNIRVTVDGKTTNFEKSSDKKYTVELASLDSNIQLSYNVNIPIPNMPPHDFTVNVKLAETPELETKNNAPVINVVDLSIYVGDKFDPLSGATSGVATDEEDGDLTSKIEVVGDVDTTKAGNYTVTYKVTDSQGATTTKTITVIVLEKEASSEDKLENGKYTIKNTTTYSGNSSMGSSMVRNSLKETSYIEVKDGKMYATLEFASDLYKTMENIKISVDGVNVAITEDKDNAKVTFEVNSVNSKIGVSAYITAMGMNISYTVGLEESTIEKISSSSTGETISGTPDSTTSGSSSSTDETTNESTSGSTSSSNTTTESAVKKGKLYTIKNTVDHESQIGKDMARKYLNSTSKVEEIDGQKYVTLTFTGSDFMKNHVIYVNGSKVSHTATAKSGDSISLRFKVSSLSDTIKVGMYVVPMSRDIQFTVKLLEDTLTFVKDYEVSSDELSTLPQTGSVIDGTMAIGVGTSLMALGGLLDRRKRK